MFRKIEEIRETLLHYLESRIELFQLEQRDRVERLILKTIYLGTGLFLLFMVFLLGIILLAIGLNSWLDSPYAGYLILFGFFVVIALVWFLFRTRWYDLLRMLISKRVQKKEMINP